MIYYAHMLFLAGTSKGYYRYYLGLGNEGRAAQGHGEELFAVRRGANADEAATHCLTDVGHAAS